MSASGSITTRIMHKAKIATTKSMYDQAKKIAQQRKIAHPAGAVGSILRNSEGKNSNIILHTSYGIN